MSTNHYYVLKISISDCYGSKHKMLDGDILGDHGVHLTLIQSGEVSRSGLCLLRISMMSVIFA